MFCRYVLRTLDVEGALAFYREALDLDFSTPSAQSGLEIFPLHEQARARGVPAHWLGQLATSDAEKAVVRFLELGGERLGPTVEGQDGATFATVRDPLGAVVGVRESTPPAHARVVWHHLHTTDLERSWSIYAEAFGWQHAGSFDASDVEGGYRTFACHRPGSAPGSATAVGSVANTARWPGVHPHWLFCFATADLEGSLALVRAKGGKALAPVVLANGDHLAPCEDPQGAAFGLLASARRSA